MADLVQYYGTGRRKSAIARVFLRPGNGEFTVNSKPFEVYFVTEQQRVSAKRPLALTETLGELRCGDHGPRRRCQRPGRCGQAGNYPRPDASSTWSFARRSRLMAW